MSGNCAICGIWRKYLECDHIIPRKPLRPGMAPGRNSVSNTQHICSNCHREKTAIERHARTGRMTLYRCGNCVLCGEYSDYLEVDHIIPRKPIHPGDTPGTNDPSNLRDLCPNCHYEKTQDERIARHLAHPEWAAQLHKLKQDPDYQTRNKAQIRSLNRKRSQDPVLFARMQARGVKRAQDPSFHDIRLATLRQVQQDPTCRAKQVASMRNTYQENHAFRASNSAHLQRVRQTSAWRVASRAGVLKKWQDPVYRANTLAALAEIRSNQSRDAKGRTLPADVSTAKRWSTYSDAEKIDLLRRQIARDEAIITNGEAEAKAKAQKAQAFLDSLDDEEKAG